MDFTPAGERHERPPERDPSPVRADYRHISKLIRPAPAITLDDAVLKWYDIAPADEPVPCELQVLARGNLRAAAESGSLDLADDLGFVILHRCGESFYFLIVATWRNDNEVWETVWAKNGEGEVSFRPWTLEGTHRPTFCVWELGAVWHEQQAWSRFLRSPRGAAAREAYLRDTFEGRGLRSPVPPEPRHAARRSDCGLCPRPRVRKSRLPPRRRGPHPPSLRGEALDRVQARVPRPAEKSAAPARPLHGALLPRRGDRSRSRPPSLCGVPARGLRPSGRDLARSPSGPGRSRRDRRPAPRRAP